MIEDLRRENTAKLRKIDPSSNTKANKNRAKQIWDMLIKNFGSDYFVEVIEEEYGISPGSNESFKAQIDFHFNSQIKELKNELSQTEQKYLEVNKSLRQEISDLADRNAELMRHDEKRLEQMVRSHKGNMSMLQKTQENDIRKKFDQKLKDANETIRELVYQRDN